MSHIVVSLVKRIHEQYRIKSAGTGSMINHLSAKHGINLQCGLVRQTEIAKM